MSERCVTESDQAAVEPLARSHKGVLLVRRWLRGRHSWKPSRPHTSRPCWFMPSIHCQEPDPTSFRSSNRTRNSAVSFFRPTADFTIKQLAALKVSYVKVATGGPVGPGEHSRGRPWLAGFRQKQVFKDLSGHSCLGKGSSLQGQFSEAVSLVSPLCWWKRPAAPMPTLKPYARVSALTSTIQRYVHTHARTHAAPLWKRKAAKAEERPAGAVSSDTQCRQYPRLWVEPCSFCFF